MFKLPEKVLYQLGGAQSSQVSAQELNVLVWNVYKGQRGSRFHEDFKRLANPADFILLQEAVLDQHMPKIWQEHFGEHQWIMAQSFQYSKAATSTGVCIGAKWSASAVEYLFAKGREFFWFTPKISLFSEFDFAGQKALIVSTHLLNFVTIEIFTASLNEIAEKISHFSGPVLLAGDFNTWNAKRYKAMKSIFANLQLEHVIFDHDKRFLKLDHIFVRGFSITAAQIHHQVSSSDHYPLEIKLRLP